MTPLKLPLCPQLLNTVGLQAGAILLLVIYALYHRSPCGPGQAQNTASHQQDHGDDDQSHANYALG